VPDLHAGLLNGAWYASVALFGAAVGASELLARYRDAPFMALRTSAARWYIALNGAASLLAYVLIVQFDFEFGATPANKNLVQALVATFGSMVFFRSSLFTIKVGETDVPVGPGIFFQVLLFATDRGCDRERAEPRSTLVNQIMHGVSFEQARDALPNFCFELMQNVPATERQQFRQVVDALASSTMPDSVKVLNLGLMLMNVVGSQVLAAAVKALGEKIQGPAKLEMRVFLELQKVSFDKAYPLLIDVCFVMSKFYQTTEDQLKAKRDVIEEIGRLAQRTDVDNAAKVVFLGLALQQRVGDAVLLAALSQLGAGIGLPAAPNASPDLPAVKVPPIGAGGDTAGSADDKASQPADQPPGSG
jgi:hypothetical protein